MSDRPGFDPDDLPGKPVPGLAPAGINRFVAVLYLDSDYFTRLEPSGVAEVDFAIDLGCVGF